MPAKLSALQFSFALTWIVYVIYLPALAAQAGIDKRYVPWILAMDQLIFITCDWAAGVYADRVGRLVGKIGGRMALVTLGSCAAFIAMPWIAPAFGAVAFLALTALWSASSSALRAPPLALVSRHAPTPKQPLFAGVYLLGFGLAAAIAPYLGLALKGVDARVPFAVASVALAVLAMLLAHAERGYEAPPGKEQPVGERASLGDVVLFALAALLFGVGFQAHFSMNSAPSYLRFVAPQELSQYMPIFWIGFNVAVIPACMLPKRFGGLPVMAAGGFVGVVALAACAVAPTLPGLVIAQLLAGAAWGVTLWAAFTAAMEAGRPDRTGLATGLLFSMLAGAALMRLAVIVSGLAAQMSFTPIPFYAWGAATLVTGMLVMRRRR
ncbi:MAG: MFS transporter [Usitatibacter sp.]